MSTHPGDFGKGGDGIVHFRREKFIPYGDRMEATVAWGDILIEVKSTLNTLRHFSINLGFKAPDGAKGEEITRPTFRRELVIYVPPGTLVYEDASGELLASG